MSPSVSPPASPASAAVTPANTSITTIITDPGPFDILCGKDKSFNNHHGNQIFRDVIFSYRRVYAQAWTKVDKMNLTKEIVHLLQTKHNARFLKCGNAVDVWEEISNQAARDKVSHALRFAARSPTLPPLAPLPKPPKRAASAGVATGSNNHSRKNSSKDIRSPTSRHRRAVSTGSVRPNPTSSTKGSAAVVANPTESPLSCLSLLRSCTQHQPLKIPDSSSSPSFEGVVTSRRRSSATLDAIAALTAFDANAFSMDKLTDPVNNKSPSYVWSSLEDLDLLLKEDEDKEEGGKGDPFEPICPFPAKCLALQNHEYFLSLQNSSHSSAPYTMRSSMTNPFRCEDDILGLLKEPVLLGDADYE
jgi:hypothetical protein